MDSNKTSSLSSTSPLAPVPPQEAPLPAEDSAVRASGLNRAITRLKAAFRRTPKGSVENTRRTRLQDRKIDISSPVPWRLPHARKPLLPPKGPVALLASIRLRVERGQGNEERVQKDFAIASAQLYSAALNLANSGLAQARADSDGALNIGMRKLIKKYQALLERPPRPVNSEMVAHLNKLPEVLMRELSLWGLDKELVTEEFGRYLKDSAETAGLLNNLQSHQDADAELVPSCTHDHKELFKLQSLQIGAALDVLKNEQVLAAKESKDHVAALRELEVGLKTEFRRMRQTAELKGHAPVSKKEMKAAKEEFPARLQEHLVKAGVGAETATIKFQKCFALRLNNRLWKAVSKSFDYDGKAFESTQTPAAVMGIPTGVKEVSGLFLTDYKGKGVSSVDKLNLLHATNLWRSDFSIGGKKAFVGIRHAIHDPVGVKDEKLKKGGAQIKAEESVIAALAASPKLFQQALAAASGEGDAPTLVTTSTSLVTTGFGSGKERKMQKIQNEAFAALANAKQPITLMVPGPDGRPKKITFRLKQARFNIPVNWGGVGPMSLITGGRRNQRRMNRQAMKELVGERNKGGQLGGFVKEFLDAKSAEAQTLRKDIDAAKRSGRSTTELDHRLKEIMQEQSVVQNLAWQVRHIYSRGSHFHQHHDAYKLASRVALLTHKMGAVPLYNCKSGKDRTGMLDAEIKFLAARIERDGKVPEPGRIQSEEDRRLFREILLNSGNLEVQEYNVGVRGYKTERVSSIDERVADARVREEIRGLSKTVGS